MRNKKSQQGPKFRPAVQERFTLTFITEAWVSNNFPRNHNLLGFQNHK